MRVRGLLLAALLLNSCATLSNRSKTLLLSGVMAGGGATVGAITVPGNERPEIHGLMWGAVAGLVGAVGGMFLFDEGAKSQELERQNAILKRELEDLRPETRTGSQSAIEKRSGSTLVRDELPHSVRGLVRPGEWTHSVFPKDQWVQKSEFYLVRECEAFTYVPPTLSPQGSTGRNE